MEKNSRAALQKLAVCCLGYLAMLKKVIKEPCGPDLAKIPVEYLEKKIACVKRIAKIGNLLFWIFGNVKKSDQRAVWFRLGQDPH